MQTLIEGKKIRDEKIRSLTNRTGKYVKTEIIVRSSLN